jgi:hypothetical protein
MSSKDKTVLSQEERLLFGDQDAEVQNHESENPLERNRKYEPQTEIVRFNDKNHL